MQTGAPPPRGRRRPGVRQQALPSMCLSSQAEGPLKDRWTEESTLRAAASAGEDLLSVLD